MYFDIILGKVGKRVVAKDTPHIATEHLSFNLQAVYVFFPALDTLGRPGEKWAGRERRGKNGERGGISQNPSRSRQKRRCYGNDVLSNVTSHSLHSPSSFCFFAALLDVGRPLWLSVGPLWTTVGCGSQSEVLGVCQRRQGDGPLPTFCMSVF